MNRKLIQASKRAKSEEYQGVLLNGTNSYLSLGNSDFYALPYNFTFVIRLNYLNNSVNTTAIQSFIRKGGTGTNRWSLIKSLNGQLLTFGFVTSENVADQLSIAFTNVKLYDWTNIILKREGDNEDISTGPGWATSVRNPANYKVYIDGIHIPWSSVVLANSTNGVNWNFNNTSPFLIGKYDSVTPTYIKMLVDYFGYYDRPLSDLEITNIKTTNILPANGAKGIFNFNGDLKDNSSVGNSIEVIDNSFDAYIEFPNSSRTALFKSGIANQIKKFYFNDPVNISRMWKDQNYTVQYSLDNGTTWTAFPTNSPGENITSLNLANGGDFWITDTASRPLNQLVVFDTSIYNPPVPTSKNIYVSWNLTNKIFTIYTKLNSSNWYAKFTLSLIVNNSIRANLWRIVGCELVLRDNNIFHLQNINMLTNGENEYVFRENGKTDLTGGYHGDELQTSVDFKLDGVSLGAYASLPSFNLKEADTSFMMTQNSNMLETDNTTATVIATHIKEDTFKYGGYESYNSLTASRAINVTSYYHGIVCITTDIAKYAKNEAGTIRTMTKNKADTEHFLTLSNAHQMEYWNDENGMSAITRAEILNNPSRDSLGITTTKDTRNYGKFYRNLPTFTMSNGEVIESKSSITFNKS